MIILGPLFPEERLSLIHIFAKVEVASSSLVARSKQRNGLKKPFLLYGDIAKW